MTEDTIEEKVVERAQQKLKLDAMVVQRGMLQGEKKLEKNEMLAAIRYQTICVDITHYHAFCFGQPALGSLGRWPRV